MSNVKNLYFSSTLKDLGYYYGVKICDLIKNYLMTAAAVFTGINIYKVVMQLAFIIVFYVALRYWVKSRIRQKYLNNEWDKEINKTRLEMRRAFATDIIMKEAGKPEGMRLEDIRLATDEADRQIEQYLTIYETFTRLGIGEQELNALKAMNTDLKKINDDIDKAYKYTQRRATRKLKGAQEQLPQVDH